MTWTPQSATARARAALLLAVAVAGLGAVWFVNPSDPSWRSWLPPCPTHHLLGLHCPGCGSTRATHHLLHGRVAAAWSFNPLLVAVGVPLGVAFLAALACAALAGVRPVWTPPRRAALAAAALLLLYMAVRNVPAESLSWLRPPEAARQER